MRTNSLKCLLGHLLILIPFLLLTPHLTFAYSPEASGLDPKVEQINPDAFDLMEDWEPEILDNYLSLGINWGFASWIKAPDNMNLLFWKSRTFGGNLYYNIPIKTSHFLLRCGISLAHAKYSSKQLNTIVRKNKTFETTIIKPASTALAKRAEVKEAYCSILSTDFIAEFGFTSNKEEANEGFFVTVGCNLGMHLAPANTIDYQEDKESKTRIIEERFNIARLRYGLLARIGWGRFGAFYHQILSPLFNEKGPDQSMRPFSFGISIDLL